MKEEKKPLQLLQRTSETDDQLLGDSKQRIPVVFVDVDLEIVTEPVVLLPLVCELTYVPAPEGLQ